MSEKRSLLNYMTFDDWNKITPKFLENKLSSINQEELEKVFKEQPINEMSRESYANLSDDQKLFLVLYGYRNFIYKETKLKDSFNNLLQQFENFKSKKELLELFGMYLTQLIHKAFLALLKKSEETKDNDALILLSKQLPANVKKIKVIVPLVPIKSPFTMYIISLLVDLTRNLSKDSKVKYKINVGWNEISYGKIKENMKEHLNFDEQLSIKNLQTIFEQNFLTYMYSLIIDAQWKVQGEEKIKIEILRKNIKFKKYTLPPSIVDIPSPIIKAGDKLEELGISRTILQDVSDYIPDNPPHLIEYYGKIVFDECSELEDDEHILFITPLSVGIIMNYLFNYIEAEKWGESKEYTHACQSVYYLCYLPFPGSGNMRNELPFYLTEYSYLLYKSEEGSKTKKISPERNYTRRLLIGAMKRLNLVSGVPTSIDEKNYKEIISILTSIFRREDVRQKEYIRYV
jgi:hypothetical protein